MLRRPDRRQAIASCAAAELALEIVAPAVGVRRQKSVRVAPARQWRQVTAQVKYRPASTTDDRTFCWGDGTNGQVGNGGMLVRGPKPVTGGLRFSRVTTGGFHTCGETTGDRAYCWGNNSNGQLGDGTNNNSRTPPVAVVGGLTFAQLSAGTFHNCGKTPASVAYCWGRNFAGEFGSGTVGKSSTPVAVAGPM
jgi:alpha-tubulin suppressor-like RCC1 family protein